MTGLCKATIGDFNGVRAILRKRAIDSAHLQADDAAAQDQHALGHFLQRQRAGAVHRTRVFGHKGQAHGLGASGNVREGQADATDPSAGSWFHPCWQFGTTGKPLFAKNERANISKAERNELAELVELLVQIWLES